MLAQSQRFTHIHTTHTTYYTRLCTAGTMQHYNYITHTVNQKQQLSAPSNLGVAWHMEQAESDHNAGK
jgi:hypothetical protein